MKLNNGRVMYDGKEYSVLELSKKYNIKYSTLYGRIFTQHWTVEDAVHGKSIKRQDGTILYNGKKCLVSELAAEFGLKYSTLYSRLFTQGLPIRKALGMQLPEKHGCADRGISEYNAWSDMKARCNTKTHKWFHRYGGRGIIVCDSWQKSFKQFIDDMGWKPDVSLTLERVDNNGHYEPGNCKWATWIEQAQNTSTNNMVTYKSETKCMAEWRRILGFPRQTMEDRIAKGWSVEKAFETPVNKEVFLTYKGDTKNLTEWAKIVNVSVGCLGGRIKKGWSSERTIETKSVKRKRLFNGELKTIGEWAKVYNIDKNTIRDRINKGWTFEKALTHKKWAK